MLPREDLRHMVANVNATNDFASFVSRVRRGFVALAEAGFYSAGEGGALCTISV